MTQANDKRQARREKKRAFLWPKVTEAEIWSRKRHDGFTSVPRTLPLILGLMDDMAGKGSPVSRTYLTLWCRLFDDGMVELDEKMAALESGFTGNRRTSSWKNRMRILEELGFIKSAPGARGEFSTVLVLNPHRVIQRHWKTQDRKGSGPRMPEEKYRALNDRAEEVHAMDFIEFDNENPTESADV